MSQPTQSRAARQPSETDASLLDTVITYMAEGNLEATREYMKAMSDQALRVYVPALAGASALMQHELLGREVNSPR